HALTGRPLSSLQGTRDVANGVGPFIAVAIAPGDRAALHAAIAKRFDAMLAAGLVAETRILRERYQLTPDMPSMRCVGYRQALANVAGMIDVATLREQGIAATRQLAKRQLTWLRGMDVATFECFAPDVADTVIASVTAALGSDPVTRRAR
ncbi:MAG TPA: tRNA dimethylallyltransferase, partial [Casimicrobiaceae bacterium]|nr:tRNA dimethylallyltransferase [Casimicrobiaceae bacterium]